MNKLYIIKCYYNDTDFYIGGFSFWNYSEVMQKKAEMEKEGFLFSLVRNDNIQMIFHAR